MIPFNRAQLAGREMEYIRTAVERGQIGGNGDFTVKCQIWLEQELGVKKALLTTSCTAALEMAALLLKIQPGDEVLVPAFSFPSTATAFALRGAKPIFVDIRLDTLNLDESQIARHVSPRTRALVVMHYAGVACEMDAIMETARKHSLPIVEDNAHGIFGKYKGRFLGTFGALATQSFHETKNITCGEGGALLINDDRFISRAEILRDKGTNRARFYRGEIDKYTWVDLGSSYAPAELLAAFLFAQLEAREEVQRRRERQWHFYNEQLRAWAEEWEVQLLQVPQGVEQPYHIFYLLLKSAEDRNRLIAHLEKSGIKSTFHYVPLHLSEMGRSFGGRIGDCPVSESASERLLRLPFYNGLTESDQKRIVGSVQQFHG